MSTAGNGNRRRILYRLCELEAVRTALSAASIVIANAVIAVGTPITERPPHRSGRAGFPHTAPPLGA